MVTALMTVSPEIHNPSPVSVSNPRNALDEAVELAAELAKNKAIPDRFKGDEKKGQLKVALLAARELRMETLQALNSFYIVNGQLSMSSDAMVGLAQRAGHKIWHEFKNETITVKSKYKDKDNKVQEKEVSFPSVRVTTVIVRAEDRERHTLFEDRLTEESDDAKITALERVIAKLEHRISWGHEEVKTAQLLGDPEGNHTKYPRAMRRHRADAEAIRMVCPEVLGAYKYTPEELGSRVTEDGAPIGVKIERASNPKQPIRTVVTPAKSELPQVKKIKGTVVASIPQQASGEPGDLSKFDAQGLHDLAEVASTRNQLIAILKQAENAKLVNKLVSTSNGKRTLRAALSEFAQTLR
ncbi:hypothetical protein ABT282_07790 [Streptomyces sp. NPDC000927]|uniref:hypothetical protein n=1 Tax=Streptomyces sp. NPDC000927 TaxID=3154371 RepID=UPI0033189766